MKCNDLIVETVSYLDEIMFDDFRNILIDEYIPLTVLKKDKVSPDILCEKLCDWFEKVQIKNGKHFDQLLEKYASDLDSIVVYRIAKEEKKKGAPVFVPRARKYYDKAVSLKKSCGTKQGLIDYSRIMLCLYSEIIKGKYKLIKDFDYSTGSLKLFDILTSMRNEKGDIALGIGRKSKFDTKDLYGLDRCSFVLTIMAFYYIKSREVEREF